MEWRQCSKVVLGDHEIHSFVCPWPWDVTCCVFGSNTNLEMRWIRDRFWKSSVLGCRCWFSLSLTGRSWFKAMPGWSSLFCLACAVWVLVCRKSNCSTRRGSEGQFETESCSLLRIRRLCRAQRGIDASVSMRSWGWYQRRTACKRCCDKPAKSKNNSNKNRTQTVYLSISFEALVLWRGLLFQVTGLLIPEQQPGCSCHWPQKRYTAKSQISFLTCEECTILRSWSTWPPPLTADLSF
jgi:hypothetical protein